MNYVLLFGMPGGGELFFIVLVIIMLFGSKKIPELARGLGKGLKEIKNATGDIQKEIREGAREMNISKDTLDIKKQVTDMIMKEPEAEVKEEKNKEEQKVTPPEDKPGYGKSSFLSNVDVKKEKIEKEIVSDPKPVQRKGSTINSKSDPSESSKATTEHQTSSDNS